MPKDTKDIGDTSVIIPPKLKDKFVLAYKRNPVILFHAPCGMGKTIVVKKLLLSHNPLYLSAMQEDFSLQAIPANCKVLIIDDLHVIENRQDKDLLCEMIRTRKQMHFILLSRGSIPGWLMSFQLAGIMESFEMSDLILDKTCIKTIAKSYEISITNAEIDRILIDTMGYPVSVAITMKLLLKNNQYTTDVVDKMHQQTFFYFDELVYRRFTPPLRKLLLQVAPFESFNVEMATLLSGDNCAGALVAEIQQNTSMLETGSLETLTFRTPFRNFLLWKLSQELDTEDQKSLFSRAGLYYELHNQIKPALDCYTHIEEHRKISELLEKNAELHVGVGQYLELEKYYFSMPEKEVLRSPILMAGMSMLCSLFMDFDRSEYWYRALQNFAGNCKKTDPSYKDTQGRLVYLDIALPQRGSAGVLDIITNVFKIMQDRHLKVPSFSVTSTLPSLLNGGKDFSEWTKRDTLLYATARVPVESILGQDGVGLADCAICESFFEKDNNYQPKLLKLLSRLSEIQRYGSPDIEFAAVGLLCRVQVSQGQAQEASETLENLRRRFIELGETRFLPNMDALLCRISLFQGNTIAIDHWLKERAPKDDLRIWVLYRYQYFTKALVLIANGEYDHALRILAPFLPYTLKCARIIDKVHIHLMNAICHFRMDNLSWQTELKQALDISCKYKFIRFLAEYGAAILPLLTSCSWQDDTNYLEKLVVATRIQAVNYPLFLKQKLKIVKPLTATEQQVLKLLVHNMSNQEICDILGIKLATAKTHVSHILQKLEVSRRSEAKEAAERLDLI